MHIGDDCELGSFFDALPELLQIGSQTFFADGCFVGGPLVHRGRVTLLRYQNICRAKAVLTCRVRRAARG